MPLGTWPLNLSTYNQGHGPSCRNVLCVTLWNLTHLRKACEREFVIINDSFRGFRKGPKYDDHYTYDKWAVSLLFSGLVTTAHICT